MSTPEPTPLNADPLRQAIDSLRGYVSQIVRTTLAWAELGEGEVLFVEGAEDFDRVSEGGGAEAIQVRDVSGSITLASRKVLEALVHFWTHRRRNPNRKVSFLYLTTAGRGWERDPRFGNRSGLDYWDQCRVPGVSLQPLRGFLADRLGPLTKRIGKGGGSVQREAREAWNAAVTDLIRFVRESSDDEFRDVLIRPVAWETAAPEREEVVKELEAAVTEKGLSLLKVPPSLAKKAVPHLLSHVWDVACAEGDRELRMVDFAEKLEEAVTVRVRLDQLPGLRSAASRSEEAALPAEPSSSSWYARVLRDRYTAAREAATAGRLEEADEQLRQLLVSVRNQAPEEDPERRRFEQGILLSRAQNSLRSGDRTGAEALHREAAVLGQFKDKNRHLAGWVLTNLGRPEEAVEELEPSDGTPQWQSTLGIALIGAGRLDRFHELLGDDEAQDSPDVLLALVRHHVGTEQAVRAEHLARRLVAQEDGTPEARFRAVEAGFAVFQLTIASVATPPVDARDWILILRRLFSDSRDVMSVGVPLLRLLVLRRRIEFHELLSEGDEVAKDFRTLVEVAPEMAAEIAAFGVTAPRDVDLMVAREGARNVVHSAIITAVHFETDGAVILRRLRELEPSAEGAEGEMLLILLLELAAAQGEDITSLVQRVGELSDPISQRIVEAGIYRQANRPEDASAVIEAALREHPESLRLLRVAYSLSRSLGPSEEEVGFAERIYDRLPAPECRLQLAESRMRTDDVDGALREAAAVEESGARRAKAAYMSAQFALQARRMSEHAAAALRSYEADGSERGRLYAAMAALRARQYGSAEKLYRVLIESDDREIQLSAYGGLAHSIDAQGGGLPSAREQSVATLLEGYDRLDAPPEIAGALYYRALGTRFEKDVRERIGRDFGSLANLPGMVAIPAEEGLEMIRREQEGAKLRIELLRAGVLPFEAAVKLGHRRASYVWFAHRRDRVLMVIDPPGFPIRSEDPILPRDPPPLLIDRTALLMLAETGLLDCVLESELTLLMERETYDWLEDEEHSLQAEGRPIQRQGLRELFETIDDLPNVEVMQSQEIDEDVLTDLQESLSWGDSYELASARRDSLLIIDDFVGLDDVPAEDRPRYWHSGDLLRSLVASENISLAEAARAQDDRPSSFGRSRGGPVPLDRAFLITHGALGAWHDCGLLRPLSECVDRLLVSPLAERHARDQLGERHADSDALTAVAKLRESLVGVVDRGRVGLVGREEDEPGGEWESEEDTDTSRALLERIAAPLRRTYGQATEAGAAIWSDDPALRLYLDPLGPMISGAVEIAHLASSLRAVYPAVKVVGTSDVMVWLEEVGLLTAEERIDLLDDISAHGRALTGESAVFVKAARTRATGSTDACVLDVAEVMPSALSPDVARRFAPRVSTTLAAAIAELWFEGDVPEGERTDAVQVLLNSLAPWVAPSLPHARFMAESTWMALVGELVQRLGGETESLLRLILTYAASDQAQFQHFLAGVWRGIDVLHGITSEAPVEVRRLGAMLVAMLAVAGQDIELHGRPILPEEMMRLAAGLFGVGGILTHAATLEGRAGSGESHLFTVEDATLENAAIETLDLLAEDPPQPVAANAVPVEIEVISDDGTVRAPFRGSVEAVRILRRLTSPARSFAAACLSLYYRERQYPEIADSVDALAADIVSDDASAADAAYRKLLTTLLESPRLWAEHDAYRAFSRLRAAPLDNLRRIAGDPEPWVADETLRERVSRIRGSITTADEYFEDVRALWGPFDVAVDQWVGLTSKTVEAANETTMLDLIRHAAQADSGYDRVVALGMALALAQMRPDLADGEMGELELQVMGVPARLRFDGSARQLLAELLAAWLRNESEPPTLEQFEDSAVRSPEALSVSGIASVHALLDRLAVGVERYVYRAVLSEQHDAEATARVAGTEECDSIGDLLLLGHRLTAVMLAPVLRQAYELGLAVVIRDLEGAHEQDPLSQGRIPVREVFVPEVLGVGGRGVNPSLVLLLAFLQRLVEWRPGNDESDDSVPSWLTGDVRSALEALAGREEPPQLRNLRNLGHNEGVSDRLGSLLAPGVEGHAESLVDLMAMAG